MSLSSSGDKETGGQVYTKNKGAIATRVDVTQKMKEVKRHQSKSADIVVVYV